MPLSTLSIGGVPPIAVKSESIPGLLDDDVRSFTVHEQLDGSAPKRVCCDLEAPHEITTLTCDQWQAIDVSGVGWSAVGGVSVSQWSDGRVAVALRGVTPFREGALANGEFIGREIVDFCLVY